MINIKTNIDKFINGTMKDIKQAVIKAETRANKRVAQTVVKEFVNELQKEYAVKDKIKKDLVIRRGRTEDGKQAESAVIVAKGKQGIPLSRFDNRQTKKGVSFMVSRSKGRKLLPGAFRATMESKHVGVFVREGAKVIPSRGRYANTNIKRQPIKQKFGPDVKMLIITERMMKLHRLVIQAKYPGYYTSELRYQLKKGLLK